MAKAVVLHLVPCVRVQSRGTSNSTQGATAEKVYLCHCAVARVVASTDQGLRSKAKCLVPVPVLRTWLMPQHW